MPQNQAIYDARQLGRAKMFILGVQHMFAMFGATVLVPALTGLSVSATLLFAGLGTLLFHFITKRKVPAFLGSSFAFIGGYQAIAPMLEDGSANDQMLPYACFGVMLAGLMYVILSALFKVFGTKKVMRYFPPIVTGPVIICIGLTLSSTAITNCRDNWAIALIAIAIVGGLQHLGQGHGEDHPHPAGCGRLLRCGCHLPGHRHAHHGPRQAPGPGRCPLDRPALPV